MTDAGTCPVIRRIEADFDRWNDLLSLIQQAFAYMKPLIDPPSSAERLTAEILRQKALCETGFVAGDGHRIAGCLFCRPESDCLYIGKLAVAPTHQGLGIGRRLVDRAADIARQHGLAELRLETRIQLVGNHRRFAAWGFAKTGQSTHPGFDAPTSIEMRKPV